MKLFTFIFSLYILVLTGVPCCASDNCEGEQDTIENTNSKQHPDKHEADDGCGTCSPFFCHSCSCCIITPLTFHIAPVASFSDPVYNVYAGSFLSLYVPFSWDPPDIG